MGQEGWVRVWCHILIVSTFKDHHRWVDMNVYHDDHEMRKQADLFTGASIVTGQESPDTDRRMREDIFKKHISGDPVARRLPNAVLAKMVSLTGRKRYDMNELLRCSGTTEESFMSIFRRSLVIVHKARFISAEDLEASSQMETLPPAGISQGIRV